MPDPVRRIEYVYTVVENRPGEGARILDVLKDAGVNLIALHAFPEGGKAQLDFFPESMTALEAAAKKAGITLSAKKTALWIEGDERIGAMASSLDRLAEAGINVIAADALRVGAKYAAIMWVAPPDLGRAAKALGSK